MITTVVLDVGGPILDEEEDFRAADAVLIDLLRTEGVDVTPEAFTEARAAAIASFSPSYNSATIWRLVAPDMGRFRRVRIAMTEALRHGRRSPTVRPEALEVLAALKERYTVALAGNQPREVRAALGEAGVLDYCSVDLLSDDLGIFKPDTRFFLAVLHAAGASAHEAVMVGDRLDNDIYPANILGMKTVHMLTGPFAAQKPRMPRDMPLRTIREMSELPAAVESIAQQFTR